MAPILILPSEQNGWIFVPQNERHPAGYLNRVMLVWVNVDAFRAWTYYSWARPGQHP